MATGECVCVLMVPMLVVRLLAIRLLGADGGDAGWCRYRHASLARSKVRWLMLVGADTSMQALFEGITPTAATFATTTTYYSMVCHCYEYYSLLLHGMPLLLTTPWYATTTTNITPTATNTTPTTSCTVIIFVLLLLCCHQGNYCAESATEPGPNQPRCHRKLFWYCTDLASPKAIHRTEAIKMTPWRKQRQQQYSQHAGPMTKIQKDAELIVTRALVAEFAQAQVKLN